MVPGHDAEPDGSECGAEPGRCGGEPTRALLDLEVLDRDLFRGENEVRSGRTECRCTAARCSEALRAAGATVPKIGCLIRLHGYFCGPVASPPRDPPCRPRPRRWFLFGSARACGPGRGKSSSRWSHRSAHAKRASRSTRFPPAADPIPSRCRPGRHPSSSRCVRSRRPVSVTGRFVTPTRCGCAHRRRSRTIR